MAGAGRSQGRLGALRGCPDARARFPVTRVIDTSARRPLAAPPSLASSLLPAAVATTLAVLAVGLRWRGSDLPAHFFRVAIVERNGFEIWNNLWYGGHHTLGYGVLFPVLGAAFGIWPVAIVSAGASAFLADVLIRQGTGRRCLMASLWFAAGTVTNVAIGRLPFALGLAIAIGALVAAQRRWIALTGVLTLATAAASPVVGAFLALVLLAWAWASAGRLRLQLLALSALAIAPVLVIAVVYPQGGHVPLPLAGAPADADRQCRPARPSCRRPTSSCVAPRRSTRSPRSSRSSCPRRSEPI